MSERPDYVKNFAKPPRTEIKEISGHWYLYSYTVVYDEIKKRKVKKSGDSLGAITPEGLIPSKKYIPVVHKEIDASAELGATYYFYLISQNIKNKLKQYFADIWETIYVMAILRLAYDGKFKRLKMNYESSIISTLFPNVYFNSGINANFLKSLGKMRDKISEYMKSDFNEYKTFLILDGHRILSASKTLDYAEKGYDSKKRFMHQINLMYIFSESDDVGHPIFYKKYTGSTPDVTAFKDLMKEVKDVAKFKDFTVIGDKGIPSEDGFEIMDEMCIKYVMPLRRGSKYVKNVLPLTLDKYTSTFSYNKRPIHCMEIYSCKDYKVFLYYDTILFAEEDQDIVLRLEKSNNAIEEKRKFEEKLRINGKGRLSDEEYNNLKPKTYAEIYKNRQEIGTVILRTNRLELTGEQVYCYQKKRQNIEEFFKEFDDTFDYDETYARNNNTLEAILFLNHLSSCIGVQALENIQNAGMAKKISFKDLKHALVKIHVNRFGDAYSVEPIKREVAKICEKINFDPSDLKPLGLKQEAVPNSNTTSKKQPQEASPNTSE